MGTHKGWTVLVSLVVLLVALAPLAVWAADEVHEGKVIAVSAGTITVMDNRDDDLDKFVVNAATTITRNGKPASLKDIQVGDRARVIASSDGTQLVAKSITANETPK